MRFHGAGGHLPLPQRGSRAGLIVTGVLVAATVTVCVGGFAVILISGRERDVLVRLAQVQPLSATPGDTRPLS